jgi:glycosyltransferase involved in cell wall biosynthesis
VFASLIHPDNYPSQSVMEAMFMGNAVVATDAGDTRRLVDERNGVLVGYREEEVAAALRQLADDEQARAAKGEASYRRTLQEFSPDAYLDHLFSLYDSVARGKRA